MERLKLKYQIFFLMFIILFFSACSKLDEIDAQVMSPDMEIILSVTEQAFMSYSQYKVKIDAEGNVTYTSINSHTDDETKDPESILTKIPLSDVKKIIHYTKKINFFDENEISDKCESRLLDCGGSKITIIHEGQQRSVSGSRCCASTEGEKEINKLEEMILAVTYNESWGHYHRIQQNMLPDDTTIKLQSSTGSVGLPSVSELEIDKDGRVSYGQKNHLGKSINAECGSSSEVTVPQEDMKQLLLYAAVNGFFYGGLETPDKTYCGIDCYESKLSIQFDGKIYKAHRDHCCNNEKLEIFEKMIYESTKSAWDNCEVN